MRIISGKFKGRRIIAPKNLPVRPTTDQAKEGLFNILWNHYDFTTLSVLDLFAGIGSISFEFSSRGTQDITSVDRDFGCIKFLKKTTKTLGQSITIIKSDVFKYLAAPKRQYNIVFADPPYNFSDEAFTTIVQNIIANSFLKQDGTLILEHSKRTNLSQLPFFVEDRKYGNSVFSFFRMEKEKAGR